MIIEIVLAILGGMLVLTNTSPLPTYECQWISELVKIDGKLDDAAWKHASPINLVLTDTGKKPSKTTSVKLLWNDKFLYLGYFCEGENPQATITERDGDLYEEEVVEAFIDADCDLKGYIELEVNPLNALFDAFVLNGKGQGQRMQVMRDWNSKGILHAVSIEENAWTCEIAVPLADFITAKNFPPKDGDVWRMNLYRIDRTPPDGEFSAWSPTKKIDYHRPQHFGFLKFKKG